MAANCLRRTCALWLASPSYALQHVFEAEIRLLGARSRCCDVAGILEQGSSYRGIDELRQRAVGLQRLDAQRAMQTGVEVDGGSFGVGPEGILNV